MIIAGGTGGHIVPGLGLALELDRRASGRTHFLSLEKNRGYADFREQSFPIHFYDAPPIAKRPKALLGFPLRFLKALLAARKLMRAEQIELVVGMGGYSIFPGMVAARLLGLPYYLCEQNAVPGRATRLFAGRATRIFLNFPVAAAHRQSFAAERLVSAGNPLRPALHDLAAKARKRLAQRISKQAAGKSAKKSSKQAGKAARQKQAARKTGARQPKLKVLVLGGSQGAAQINAMVLAAVQQMQASGKASASGIVGRWIVQCGEKNLPDMQSALGELNAQGVKTSSVELLGYHPRIADFYAQADVIVARAGAGVLAEALAFGLPMILVPYPFAADNHQLANAEYLAEAGAAACIRTRGTEPDELVEILTRWHRDGELATRAARAAELAMPDAAQTIADVLDSLENFDTRKANAGSQS